MAWVHILKTKSDKYYVGSTSDLKSRKEHHTGGWTSSTKALGNPFLVLAQEYATLKEARDIERKIKRLKRRDYIEKMLKDGYIRLLPR